MLNYSVYRQRPTIPDEYEITQLTEWNQEDVVSFIEESVPPGGSATVTLNPDGSIDANSGNWGQPAHHWNRGDLVGRIISYGWVGGRIQVTFRHPMSGFTVDSLANFETVTRD